MPSGRDSSSEPLLPQSRASHDQQDAAGETVAPNETTRSSTFTRRYSQLRKRTRTFLESRTQHYALLLLISLDVLAILTDIFINLYTCEEGKPSPKWDEVRNGLAIAGLVFSCLFMVELGMSLWAFGWRYLSTPFHIFDALVILTSFVLDVLLHGVLEEVASLVIIFRLWRFFKIFEEFSVGAEEQMEALQLRLDNLEQENVELKKRLGHVKCNRNGDEESLIGRQSTS